ncbi:MAG TPA: hypothetical protein VFE10_03495 [Phenylobacterium sp.]|jgi:hypothetical protein|nr:hypothetical protein [Phenylobacterium sp.]
MMLVADYEVMARYALEDAERTANPVLKALHEAHARQWLELAAAASGDSKAAERPALRLSVPDPAPDREPRHRPSKAA